MEDVEHLLQYFPNLDLEDKVLINRGLGGRRGEGIILVQEQGVAPSEVREVLKRSHVPWRRLSESAKSLVDSAAANTTENQPRNEAIGRRSQRKRRTSHLFYSFPA